MKKLFILLLALMLLSGCGSKKPKSMDEINTILEKNGYYHGGDNITSSVFYDNRNGNHDYCAHFTMHIQKNGELSCYYVFGHNDGDDIKSLDISEENVIYAYSSQNCGYDFAKNSVIGKYSCSVKEIEEAKKLKNDFLSFLKEMDLTVSDIYSVMRYLMIEFKYYTPEES